jgi:FkbM family methyltransferase
LDVRDGDVVFDIGASIGQFTCWAAALGGPNVQVHAFEPEPRTAARARENAALNKLDNVHIHEVALSDRDGSFMLSVHGLVGVGTHSLFADHALELPVSHTVEVPVRTPESYTRDRNIPEPTLLKLDVEGAEAGVLRGIDRWLTSGRLRRLDVEFHVSTLASQGENHEELEKWIVGHGYKATERLVRNDTVNVTFIRS